MKVYLSKSHGLLVAAMALLATTVAAKNPSSLRGVDRDDLRLLAPLPKVEICHIPPGNPDNFHTISVSENALDAHLAHGDPLGSCDAHCDVLCDDANACTIDYDAQAGCDNGNCYPEASRPAMDCDDHNACTIDTCDAVQGCLYEDEVCDDNDVCTTDTCNTLTGCAYTAVTCDDGNLCTTDSCDPVNGCAYTPITCPSGQVCDATTGVCTNIQEVVPCVAVIDEWSYTQATVQGWWNSFRTAYPKRPFCLLNPLPQGDTRYLPTDFLNDGQSPDGIVRTIQATVTRDGGNVASASDWFSACQLSQYTSATSTINFVGLFIDVSGSMTLSTVSASHDKFLIDLTLAGLNYAEVYNGAENWVAPFMTDLAP